MVLGFVAAFAVARWLARRDEVPVRHVENLILLTAATGVAGAMVFGKIFYAHQGFWSVLRVWEGGPKVYLGGFIAAALATIIYCHVQRLPVGRILDICAPGVALGLAIGRVGCFLGGCCWGDVCVDSSTLTALPPSQRTAIHTVPWLSPAAFPLAVTFPSGSFAHEQHVRLGLLDAAAPRSLPVHPVQIYESIAALALSCWLIWLCRRPRVPGAAGLSFIVGYASIRFVLEFLRAGNPPDYFGLTISQVIAFVLAAGAIAIVLLRRSRVAASAPSDVERSTFDCHG